MRNYVLLNEQRLTVETRKRVAAYCRVSTDRDDQANSFDSQQRYFKEYIERMLDWELYDIFADEGVTGTSIKKRKAFNRMIALAKRGDFDLIITKEISRFARNTLDSVYYTRNLKKHGVGVLFLNDNINTLDSDAELRLTILSSIAQEESRKTSDRVKWGQKRRMEQGVVFGRSMLGYDVRDGQMFINEDGAKIVRLIFDKYVNEGKGSHTIARELREEGYKTLTGNTIWTNTVIYKILRNEKYCGDLVQKKTFTPDYLSHDKKYNRGEDEFIMIKNHHEPIISRKMFEDANNILDSRTIPKGKSKHSNRYPFSGKIRCGKCGESYVTRHRKRKDGSRYMSWRCAEGAKHGNPYIDKSGNHLGCSNGSIRNDDALQVMYLVVKSLQIERKEITQNIIAAVTSVASLDTAGTDIEILREKIRSMEDKKARLLDLYMNKGIGREEYVSARTKCEDEVSECNGRIEYLENQYDRNQMKERLNADIANTIHNIMDGMAHEEEFYTNILDKMVIEDRNHISVYLKLLPHKWSYAVREQ